MAHEGARTSDDGRRSEAEVASGPIRAWTVRTQRAVRGCGPQRQEIAGVCSRLDGAILGGVSSKEPQREVRKSLPMRSQVKLKLTQTVVWVSR